MKNIEKIYNELRNLNQTFTDTWEKLSVEINNPQRDVYLNPPIWNIYSNTLSAEEIKDVQDLADQCKKLEAERNSKAVEFYVACQEMYDSLVKQDFDDPLLQEMLKEAKKEYDEKCINDIIGAIRKLYERLHKP